MIGVDIQQEFIDLGYELFKDKDTLQSEFIAADIFNTETTNPLAKLDDRVDIIHASSFFHLFGWEDQKKIARRVVKLLRARKGSLLVGRQVGDENPGEKVRRSGTGSRYRHNADSWRTMWNEVGKEVGVDFEVKVTTRPMTVSILSSAGRWR